jgi:hypothetical protein
MHLSVTLATCSILILIKTEVSLCLESVILRHTGHRDAFFHYTITLHFLFERENKLITNKF